MKARGNLLVGIFVFLISTFFITQAVIAAPPDYKTMPLHKVIEELNGNTDKKARETILDKISGRKPETKQDIDALNAAIDADYVNVQLYAIQMVKETKDPRSIKKLIDKVKAIKTHSFLPVTKSVTVTQFILMGERAAVPGFSVRVLSDLKNEEALHIIIDKLGEVTQRGIMIDEALRENLRYYGPMALPHIAKKLDEMGEKPTVGREHFLYVIRNMRSKEAANDLRKLTANKAIDVRAVAYRVLGEMGERLDVARIFAEIDTTQSKQAEFIGTVREHRGDYSVPNEEDSLSKAKDNLFAAISQPGNTDALPILKQRVEAARKKEIENYLYHVGAELRTISAIGGPEAFTYLKKLYDEIPVETIDFGDRKGEKNYKYKTDIMMYFGRKNFVEAIPFLTSIMNDKNEAKVLRAAAARKLYSITGDGQYMQIDEDIRGGKR